VSADGHSLPGAVAIPIVHIIDALARRMDADSKAGKVAAPDEVCSRFRPGVVNNSLGQFCHRDHSRPETSHHIVTTKEEIREYARINQQQEAARNVAFIK
jgi:hypothetical protein